MTIIYLESRKTEETFNIDKIKFQKNTKKN